MKTLIALSLMGTTLLVSSNQAKADYNYYGIKSSAVLLDAVMASQGFGGSEGYSDVTELYKYNSITGNKTLLNTYQHCNLEEVRVNSWKCRGFSGGTLNKTQDAIEFIGGPNNSKKLTYTINEDSWTISDYDNSTTVNHHNSYNESIEIPTTFQDSEGNTKLIFEGEKLLEKKTNGSVQIGSDSDDIDITAEGLNIDGNPLITKKDNGEIHIGKNSLITKSEEETLSDGTKVQPLYAKDADGNKIPINIDGSKLLIDGVEVTAGGDSTQVTTNKNDISTNKANIKNLGEGVAGSTALTAALSALPQTSKESKLSCGVGTGAYSSRYAVGFGCASKVNERVDINAGGSYVFGGSKSYGEGTLDSGVLKAGFVFKLGELNKPTQISMKNKKVMETKIETLEEKNKQLLARLERLEKIALGESNSKDLVVYKLK